MNKATANLLCQWMTLKDQQHHHIHIIIEMLMLPTPTHQQRCPASLRAVKRKTTTDTYYSIHHTTQHNQQPSHNNASIQHLPNDISIQPPFITSTIHHSSYHIITFNITMSYDNNDDCFCWWLYCIIASHQLFQ